MTKPSPTIAITIKLSARPGKENELSDLLSAAAGIVKATEETLYWFSTRLSSDTFTINDGFATEDGVNAHFGGQVAALLKAKAEELVTGGWENGVLPNVVRSTILSSIG